MVTKQHLNQIRSTALKLKNCTQVKLHHKEISHFNISVVSRDVHCLFKSVKHSPTSFLQPLSQPERWGKRKKWETGRKRGRKSVSKRERERWRLRQTVWLHRDLQHSASYDSGVRGYPHWWISGPSLVSLHKRKGVVFTPLVWKVYFRNPSCQHETVNLSQGRRVTSTNITLFFSSSSSRFYRPAKTSRDALSHSDASKGVITQQWRIGGTYSRCVYFLVKHTSLGFWQDLEDYSLQAANCVKEHWCFVFILFIPNSSSHEPSHYIPVY